MDFPDLVSGLVLVNALGVSPGRRALIRTVVPGPHWRIGMQRSTAVALLSTVAREGGWGSLAGAARWVLSGSLEPEMEELRSRDVRSAVLWGSGDTLLPQRIGERAAELLGGSFESVTSANGWPGRRAPDHDWPLRAPEFFAGRLDETIAELGPRKRPPSRTR